MIMSSYLLPAPLLTSALRLDAVASGGLGVVSLAGAGFLASLLGLPAVFLMAVGAVCLGWAAFLAFLASRQRLASTAAWAVIALNLVWVVESAMIVVLGWIEPTPLGYAFVVAQAVAVALFACLQFVGLKQSREAGVVAP
jgi:hypothetical protein